MASIEYTPPPTVKEFIKHFRAGELFLDWIVGPVGSGKTTGIFMKLIFMAQMQAPSPIDGIRRSRCVVVRNTAPQLRDTTIKSFMYWFKDGQAGKWKATDKDFVLRYGDVECEVMFRPLDTPDDINRVLSLEVTFAIIDEFVELPQAIVEALSARCGRYPPEIEGGATNWGMWGASNPGMESVWWYPMLEEEARDQLPPDQEVPENWTYFKQPSGFSEEAENTANLPGKRDYYTNLAKGKTKHWIKQFIEVEWGYSLVGKPVYPMFNRDFHVSKRILVPNRSRQLVAGYDPGMRSALVLGQYDDSVGRVLVFDEIVLEDFATDRMIAEKLKPLLMRKYVGFEFLIVPDPASVNESQAKQGSSVITELKKHFAVHYDTDNSIESRIAPVQYYMMRLTGDGPALTIDPACIKLTRALTGGYKYTVSKTDVQREVPDKSMHSHVANAFEYLVRYFRRGEERAGKKVATRGWAQRNRGNPYAVR
ncbi:hypothetical protein [Burkholderia sp. BE12]|uniref:hypothetical protein n=1 Tax=Burkholderia sp. BE12 TaxID=2082394 RepID=UPI000CF5443B|nr:hypothetical protein [Burkholderia sp. BE12]